MSATRISLVGPAGRGGLLALFFTGLCALVPVCAQPPQAGAAAGSAPDAGHWLARIQQAATGRSYQGTVISTGGGMSSSSRVLHICDGNQHYERIEVLDGKPRTLLRHNDQLLTQWPAQKLAVQEQREAVVDFPGLPAVAGLRVTESYELRQVGSDRIAGHEADVLMVKPRDRLRFAQRWWAERETGLLLRTETLGPQGESLEVTSFTDLKLDARIAPEQVTAPMKRLEGWRVQRLPVQRAQLEAEGWALSRPVPGFSLVSCSKRTLEPGADDAAPAPQVLQTVFSDGITPVSLFIEPFDAQRHRQPVATSAGALHTLASRHGDWWVTIVGDVPMPTLRQFDAALERRR